MTAPELNDIVTVRSGELASTYQTQPHIPGLDFPRSFLKGICAGSIARIRPSLSWGMRRKPICKVY